jgi:AP-1-like transcription factor
MDSGSDETESKPKKKPGRKMMMTEPANKRKAQNRAAQRAFRERKEAHVKGLETRVTELEELTENKDKENQHLKTRIQALQTELMAIRGQNFNFDFSVKNVQNPTPLTNGTTVRNPFQSNGVQNAQQPSPSPSSGSITDSSAFRSGQSSLATSPENDINKNATPNIDIPFDLFSSNSAGPTKFTTNSNHTTPLFSTDLFSNSPAITNTSAPLFNQNTTQTSPILDSFAQTLASLTQNQSPQNLSNGFNLTMPSSTSTAPLTTFSPTSTANLFDMNDPLFNTWRDNSMSATDNDNFDIFDTMFSSMSPGAFNLVDTTGLTDFISDSPVQITQSSAADPNNPLPCPELWTKVTNHRNFEDIDIDNLCAEMKAKAKVCVLSKSSIVYR